MCRCYKLAMPAMSAPPLTNQAATHSNPALYNATLPGLADKGPNSEPPIDLEIMLDLTAAASVDCVRCEGADLFLAPQSFRERLAAEGDMCWACMHSQRRNVELLEMVGRPETLGFLADMAHTMLFIMGYNAPEDRLLPPDFDWSRREVLADAYLTTASALRPWTIDFHVAQNDGTVKGAGSDDKTGRHCAPDDPNGKVDIVEDTGANTWKSVLRTIIAARNTHGWD